MHHPGDNIAFPASVFLKYGTVFRLMETLQNHLLGSLSGNSPGIGRGSLYHYRFIQLYIWVDTPSILKRYLTTLISWLFNSNLLGPDLDRPRIGIDLDLDILVRGKIVLPVG